MSLKHSKNTIIINTAANKNHNWQQAILSTSLQHGKWFQHFHTEFPNLDISYKMQFFHPVFSLFI